MNIVHEIDSYIKFLKSTYGLWLTLHPAGNEYLISNSDLIQYNIHSTPYCLYMKTNADFYNICIQKHRRIKDKLHSQPAFTGVCHAGVKERVYGLFVHNEYLGFVSVSGYRPDNDNTLPHIKNLCSEFYLSKSTALDAYDKLSQAFPDEAFLDSLIVPLCRMIEYGNILLMQTDAAKSALYSRIVQYINRHFCEDISVERLADELFTSKSQISHTFKKLKGVSVSDYVTRLRLELAENLLRNTKESITNIALIAGFSDSSYFSNVFKRYHGITPCQYRKQHTRFSKF